MRTALALTFILSATLCSAEPVAKSQETASPNHCYLKDKKYTLGARECVGARSAGQQCFECRRGKKGERSFEQLNAPDLEGMAVWLPVEK